MGLPCGSCEGSSDQSIACEPIRTHDRIELATVGRYEQQGPVILIETVQGRSAIARRFVEYTVTFSDVKRNIVGAFYRNNLSFFRRATVKGFEPFTGRCDTHSLTLSTWIAAIFDGNCFRIERAIREATVFDLKCVASYRLATKDCVDWR